MRKNRTMRVAALLLALTLITSCFVGGTFAKYTTSQNTSDTARVAHWGFNAAETVTFKLFDTSSDTGIQTIEGTNLIAPGSTNTVTFTLVNADADTAPEVAYKITVDTTGTTAALSTELEEALSFTLDETTYDTWEALITAVKTLSGDASGSKEYAAGTAVPDALANNKTHTIGWTWAFERNDDVGDTSLGNKAIAELEKLTLSIKITVDQLDVYPTPANP